MRTGRAGGEGVAVWGKQLGLSQCAGLVGSGGGGGMLRCISPSAMGSLSTRPSCQLIATICDCKEPRMAGLCLRSACDLAPQPTPPHPPTRCQAVLETNQSPARAFLSLPPSLPVQLVVDVYDFEKPTMSIQDKWRFVLLAGGRSRVCVWGGGGCTGAPRQRVFV